MVKIFFNSERLQLLDKKHPGIKIDASYFLNKIIIQIIIFLYNDISPVHMAELMKQDLDSSKLSKMDHLAYSPDLAPSDFGLFGTMKNSFTEYEFETEEELIQAIYNYFVIFS